MESCPGRHRHSDDPRTSARWVQLTNHSPLIAISNEVVPHSKSAGSHWRRRSRPCVCMWLCVCALQSTQFLSKSNSIRREHPEHVLWFNICVWLYEKENTYCLLFLSFTTDWFSFPSSCLGPSCLFPSRFFFFSFFFRALHLALLSDFLPLAYGGLLLRQPLWPFDCMETRFCTSVTDAANDWRETMEKGNRARGEGTRGGGEESRAD